LKEKIKIGVVCVARKTFDYIAAEDIFKKIQIELKKIENIDWEITSELVIEIEDAQGAAQELKSKGIDGLVCISGTFALGHLILELNKVIQKPILLWGLEELPYDGGKIRLNSVCGINLNSSNLYKAGVKNIKAFATKHIGIIGYRAKGFFNLDVDELDLYREVGLLIDHFELNEIYKIEVDTNKVKERIEQIKEIFDVSSISGEQLNNVAELTSKINIFLDNNQLDALAIRCWPEFATDFGIAPCAAMSVLQAEGKILTCEGDILGSLSMVAHSAIGAKNPYLADFSQVDFKENFALLWHCGVAPCNLWDGKCNRSLEGEYRLFLQKGKIIPMEKELKGTYAKAVFEDHVKDVLKKIIDNGIAHHLSVVYDDYIRPLEIFAKIMGWKVIQ